MSGQNDSKSRGYTGFIALCVALNACITAAFAATLPIFLTVELGATYFDASLFMIAGTLASSAAVYVLGRVGDVPRLRYPVTITTALSGLAGSLCLAFATGYWVYFLVFVSLIAIAGSLFSQLMALAFIHDRSSTGFIRALASAGWVAGPPLGGLIATVYSQAAVFYAAAATYALLTVFIAGTKAFFSQKTSPVTGFAVPSAEAKSGQKPIVFLVLTLSSVHLLISISALGIPWRIVQIGGTEFHVGLAFSIAAAIEVPIIAGSNAIRNRFGYTRTLLLSCVTLCVYFLTASLMENLFGLVSLSVINGIVTGTMMGLSLIVLQERLADRPAHASSIYSNILRLSYVGALLVAGVIAQIISVVAIFWIAGAIAFCLGVGLVVWRPFGSADATTAEAAPSRQS